MKKLLFAMIFLVFLIAVPAYAYGPSINNPYANESGIPLTVQVDGKYISTDVDPYISNGRTYLPLRAVAEAMGAAVNWDNISRSVTIVKDSTIIRCTVGSNAFTVDGKIQYSDTEPQIRNGRTMLPIRSIVEALGNTIEWDGYTATVSIDTPAANASAQNLPTDIPYEVRWLVEKYYVPSTSQDIGSWYCVVPSNKVYTALRYTHNYLFISEMNNGKKNAIIVGCSIYDGQIQAIGVDHMEVTPTINGFHLKDTWSPHYWNGGGIGSSEILYLLVNYEYIGKDLLLTGCWTKSTIPMPGIENIWYQLDAYFYKL